MRLHIYTLFAAICGLMFSAGANASTARDSFIKSLDGFQFGLGVPLMTPLTGYNMFVGYVNKNASTFLGRRFGLRADFTIPSPLRARGKLSDNGVDGYDLNLHIRGLGLDFNASDFVGDKLSIDYEQDDAGHNIEMNGLDTTMTLKNQNMGLLVDFYPFGNTWFLGGIRFTGGYYIGELNIDATVRAKQDVGFRYSVGNNTDFIYAKVPRGSNFNASFDWQYHGLYAGIGFDLGIFRGFKFFMDAGVVFANTPHVSTRNINDKNVVITGCYEINGQPCGTQNMVTIIDGMNNEPDVNQVVQDTVGSAAHEFLSEHQAEYETVVDLLPPGFLDSIGSIDTITANIFDFLNDETPTLDNTEPWIKELVNNAVYDDMPLAETIETVKQEWRENAADAVAGVQKDVDDIWAEYNDNKQDAIDDINDFLRTYHMIPMIKIGFMYRF